MTLRVSLGTFHTTGESITYGDGTGERDARVAHEKQSACCAPEERTKKGERLLLL